MATLINGYTANSLLALDKQKILVSSLKKEHTFWYKKKRNSCSMKLKLHVKEYAERLYKKVKLTMKNKQKTLKIENKLR